MMILSCHSGNHNSDFTVADCLVYGHYVLKGIQIMYKLDSCAYIQIDW